MKFRTHEIATQAVNISDNYVLDKKHTFRVCLYTDLDKILDTPANFVAPTPPEFKPRPNPCSWLTDPDCRDQFVVRYSHETEVCWSTQTQNEEPELVYGGEREKESGKTWCESYVQWSPQGSYLTTFHPAGVKLWGGSDFQSQGRYMHAGVEAVDFSPCEQYMVTYTLNTPDAMTSKEAIIVWNVRTGEKLRAFSLKSPLDVDYQVEVDLSEEKGGKKVDKFMRGRIVSLDNYSCTIAEGNTHHTDIPLSKVVALQDPNRLKWSADGRFIARLGVGIIQVYALPTMALLDKKSLAAKDILDFTWSPSGSMISYWSPAFGNHPAMINIVQMPERTPICSRKVVLVGRSVLCIVIFVNSFIRYVDLTMLKCSLVSLRCPICDMHPFAGLMSNNHVVFLYGLGIRCAEWADDLAERGGVLVRAHDEDLQQEEVHCAHALPRM